MAVTRLRHWASRAPVPVFPALGLGHADRLDELRVRPDIEAVASPRHARLLLVIGEVPPAMKPALDCVHDQLPPPRATAVWETDQPVDALVADLVRLNRELVVGASPSEADRLPDEPPARWQGIGPYGQGGEGMMGGVPYGRPMAMTADDRDGLALDRLEVRVGPFFPAFPAGLEADVELQGDLVQAWRPAPNPFAGAAPRPSSPFARALLSPVPLAELELSRARHHLRWLGRFLALHGLGALGQRVQRLATRLGPGGQAEVVALGRWLRRTGALWGATAGVGELPEARRAGLPAGVVSRAAGGEDDARSDDPVYRRLGFGPVVGDRADTLGRWRQRLAEAAQALTLADRAGSAMLGPCDRVEDPRGPLGPAGAPGLGATLDLVPEMVEGTDWATAVTAIASLDLTLEPAATAVGVART